MVRRVTLDSNFITASLPSDSCARMSNHVDAPTSKRRTLRFSTSLMALDMAFIHALRSAAVSAMMVYTFFFFASARAAVNTAHP